MSSFLLLSCTKGAAAWRPCVRLLSSPAGSSVGPISSNAPSGGNTALPPYQSVATPPAPKELVGPGASKDGDYKCTEYFCYSNTSYFDLEVEMVKDRLPQPVAENGQM